MKRYLLFVLGVLPIVASHWACGAQTAGTRVRYQTAFAGSLSSGAASSQFTNKLGWKIQLAEAKMLVGPIYFYSGEPRASLWKRWFGVGAAAACTTHAQFDSGKILGEVQEQVVVDLLASEPTALGVVSGVSGHMQSLELHLHPPGTLQDSSIGSQVLGNSTLVMKGKASKDNTEIPFQVSFNIPDIGKMRIIESISSDVLLEEPVVKNGTLVVQVYLDRWFTNVNFGTLEKKDKSGVSLIDAANIALLQGIRSRYSYGATWKK